MQTEAAMAVFCRLLLLTVQVLACTNDMRTNPARYAQCYDCGYPSFQVGCRD
jgi:hypothetical protein